MLFSNVPGPSSGRLGPFVGDVFQVIRPDEKKSELLSRLPLHRGRRGASLFAGHTSKPRTIATRRVLQQHTAA